MDFAALGSNIIATSNRCAGTVVFDTEAAALAIGNPLPDTLLDAVNYFLTAGDALFAFAYYSMRRPHSFEVMTATKDDDDDSIYRMIRPLCPSTDWSWQSVPAPFTEHERIKSYALHPDGRTVFVSSSIGAAGTLSIDTRNNEWRRHGEWTLPFELQGYFDADLDAWVGLHADGQDGYICACQVPSRSGTTMQEPPSWKIAKEKMWSPWDQVAKGRGATLTYMGNSRFCLVDCVARDGLDFQDAFGDCNGCVLNITTFCLRYNHEGKLRIINRNTTSCPVSKHLSSFSPIAFWM
jgi:hypothetical protein